MKGTKERQREKRIARREKRIVQRLRQAFDLPDEDCSDGELLRVTRGTLTRASVELNIAADEFRLAMVDSVPRALNKLFKQNRT